MENCLVEKLKGVVDNENLDILGYYKYRFLMNSTSNGGYVRVISPSDIILLDGKWIGTDSRVRSLAAQGGVSLNKDNVTPDEVGQQYCTVLVPKYYTYAYTNVDPVGDEPLRLSGYEWINPSLIPTQWNQAKVELRSTHPGTIGGKTISGLNYAPMDKLTVLSIENYKLLEVIDVTQLGSGGILTLLNMSHCQDVVGTLDNLGKSDVFIEGVPDTKNVSIDLVNFVNNNRSAGRTTGSKNIPYLGNLTVKVNGTEVTIELHSTNTLAWTADSITLNGTPVEELTPASNS